MASTTLWNFSCDVLTLARAQLRPIFDAHSHRSPAQPFCSKDGNGRVTYLNLRLALQYQSFFYVPHQPESFELVVNQTFHRRLFKGTQSADWPLCLTLNPSLMETVDALRFYVGCVAGTAADALLKWLNLPQASTQLTGSPSANACTKALVSLLDLLALMLTHDYKADQLPLGIVKIKELADKIWSLYLEHQVDLSQIKTLLQEDLHEPFEGSSELTSSLYDAATLAFPNWVNRFPTIVASEAAVASFFKFPSVSDETLNMLYETMQARRMVPRRREHKDGSAFYSTFSQPNSSQPLYAADGAWTERIRYEIELQVFLRLRHLALSLKPHSPASKALGKGLAKIKLSPPHDYVSPPNLHPTMALTRIGWAKAYLKSLYLVLGHQWDEGPWKALSPIPGDVASHITDRQIAHWTLFLCPQWGSIKAFLTNLTLRDRTEEEESAQRSNEFLSFVPELRKGKIRWRFAIVRPASNAFVK